MSTSVNGVSTRAQFSQGLAPVVLFAFARPEHTRRCIEALRKAELAAETDLWVYADAGRTPDEWLRVKFVRKLLREIIGFKSVTIIERSTNFGLSRNIAEGVSEVCGRHGKVIVLEDDIIVSTTFLRYMNEALVRFETDRRVWHVSGWNYPMDVAGLGDAFFWRVMNCWGWATWEDRWRHYSKNAQTMVATWRRAEIERFNVEGAYDFWAQVKANASGQMNTWAVFWYATIFSNGGLCLNPAVTQSDNIGHDGSGENCNAADEREVRLSNALPNLDIAVQESELAILRLGEHFAREDIGLLRRTWRTLKRLMHAGRLDT